MTTVTRALVEGLFPLPGQGLYDPVTASCSPSRTPSDGTTLSPACNRETYEALGYPDHVNCTDN